MDITEERFWAKVEKGEGCWNWTASQRSKGYGAFCYPKYGRMIQGRAHRYSYELHVGEIPPGLFVLHRCDNPKCVNPEHLFLGTNEDNVRDMMAKGRHKAGGTYCKDAGKYKKGDSHHNAKMTPDKVRAMREAYAKGDVSMSQLGRDYGISGSNIFKIIRRTSWKSVE